MDKFSLKGKVALVTGSTKGLGKGIAKALGEAGAKVAVNYLNNRENAECTLRELQDQGVHAMLVRADAANKE